MGRESEPRFSARQGKSNNNALEPLKSKVFSGSIQPDGRISAAMQYCQDNDTMFLCTKINAERKTFSDNPPNVLMYNSKLERVFRYSITQLLNFSNELFPQTNALAFIPCSSFAELRAGSR